MNAASKDAHADDGGAFGTERVILEVENLPGIHHGFTLFFLNGRLGGFLPFFEGVHDMVDDGPGDEFHLTLVVFKLLRRIVCVGLGGEAKNDTLKGVSGGLGHQDVLFVDRPNGRLTNRDVPLVQLKSQRFETADRVGLDDDTRTVFFSPAARPRRRVLAKGMAGENFVA